MNTSTLTTHRTLYTTQVRELDRVTDRAVLLAAGKRAATKVAAKGEKEKKEDPPGRGCRRGGGRGGRRFLYS